LFEDIRVGSFLGGNVRSIVRPDVAILKSLILKLFFPDTIENVIRTEAC